MARLCSLVEKTGNSLNFQASTKDPVLAIPHPRVSAAPDMWGSPELGTIFCVSLPEFLESPWTSQTSPEFPRKFLGDFPGTSLTVRRFPMEPFLETLWGPLVPISAY